MRQYKQILPAAAAAMGMLALILDPKTGLRGAAEGVSLCVSTVIPALFPFFVISAFLTSAVTGVSFLRPVGKLLKLPRGGETYLLLGFLGGYPVGARCIAQGYRAGNIRKANAERMLGFCSNAGPAFLFGMGANVLPEPWMCALVWAIHILSALLVGLTAPAAEAGGAVPPSGTQTSLADAMKQALSSMAGVCGWVVIMKVVLSFLQRWVLWLLPINGQIFFSGLLELTNGTCGLAQISSVGLRFLMFSVFLSFGGLCVLLQTQSALQGSGLSSARYFPGKVTQAAISYLLSCTVLPLVDPGWMPGPLSILPAAGIVVFHLILSASWKNNSSIPRCAGV